MRTVKVLRSFVEHRIWSITLFIIILELLKSSQRSQACSSVHFVPGLELEEIKLETSSLTKIDLSHNEYVTIEKSLFRNMKDLVKINLSNNKIFI